MKFSTKHLQEQEIKPEGCNQSGHSMTELEEACLRLKTECLKLPLICPTRWNCHHKMITALQGMKEFGLALSEEAQF